MYTKLPRPGPNYLFPKRFYCLTYLHLTNVLYVFASGSSLRDSQQATISVIPKEGKDLNNYTSYHPISLLNAGLKILTKTLASRLLTCVPDITGRDQVGFLPGWEARDNVIKVLNIIQGATATSTPAFSCPQMWRRLASMWDCPTSRQSFVTLVKATVLELDLGDLC